MKSIKYLVSDVFQDSALSKAVLELIEAVFISWSQECDGITNILNVEKMTDDQLLELFQFYGIKFTKVGTSGLNRYGMRKWRGLLHDRGTLKAIRNTVSSGGQLVFNEPIECKVWHYGDAEFPLDIFESPEDGVIYVVTNIEQAAIENDLIKSMVPATYKLEAARRREVQLVNWFYDWLGERYDPIRFKFRAFDVDDVDDVDIGRLRTRIRTKLVPNNPVHSEQWTFSEAVYNGQTYATLYHNYDNGGDYYGLDHKRVNS